MIRRPPISTRTDTLFPYPTPFRSRHTHCPSIINWNLRHPTNLDCIVVFVLRIFGWRVFFVEWNFFVALRVVHVREPHDASHAEIFDAVFYFLARLSLNVIIVWYAKPLFPAVINAERSQERLVGKNGV